MSNDKFFENSCSNQKDIVYAGACKVAAGGIFGAGVAAIGGGAAILLGVTSSAVACGIAGAAFGGAIGGLADSYLENNKTVALLSGAGAGTLLAVGLAGAFGIHLAAPAFCGFFGGMLGGLSAESSTEKLKQFGLFCIDRCAHITHDELDHLEIPLLDQPTGNSI